MGCQLWHISEKFTYPIIGVWWRLEDVTLLRHTASNTSCLSNVRSSKWPKCLTSSDTHRSMRSAHTALRKCNCVTRPGSHIIPSNNYIWKLYLKMFTKVFAYSFMTAADSHTANLSARKACYDNSTASANSNTKGLWDLYIPTPRSEQTISDGEDRAPPPHQTKQNN